MAPVTLSQASAPAQLHRTAPGLLTSAKNTVSKGKPSSHPLQPQDTCTPSVNEAISKASSSWLKCNEVVDILTSAREGGLPFSDAPAVVPPGGTLYLYDRVSVKYFRSDGHNWKKKPDGKAVRETHEKLKLDQVVMLNCYYAHAIEPDNLQRRCYWLLDSKDSVVLVHYLRVTPETGGQLGRGKRNSLDSADMWAARSSMPDASMSNVSSFISPSLQQDSSEVTSDLATGDQCSDWNFYSRRSHGVVNRRRRSMDPASLLGYGGTNRSFSPRPSFHAETRNLAPQPPVFNSFTGELMQPQTPADSTGDIIDHLSNLDCGTDVGVGIGEAAGQMPFGFDSTNSSGSFNSVMGQNQPGNNSGQLMRQVSSTSEPLQQAMPSSQGQQSLQAPFDPQHPHFLSNSSISSAEDFQMPSTAMAGPAAHSPMAQEPLPHVEPWTDVADELLQLMSDDLVATARTGFETAPSTAPSCSASCPFSIVETCPAVVQPGAAHRVVVVVDGMENFDPHAQTFSVNVGGILCEPVWIQNGAISFTTPALQEGIVQIALVNPQEGPWQQLSPFFTVRVAPDMSVRIFQRCPLPGSDRDQQMTLIRSLLKNRSAADVCSLVA